MGFPTATRNRCPSRERAPTPLQAALLGALALALLCGCATSLEGPLELGASEPDPRLRSAGLLRASGADAAAPVPADRESERLVAHFDAVLEILAAQTPASLARAQQRLESDRGPLPASERRALAERLAAERSRNLAVLRSYRDRGRFPVNEEVADRAVPIFVDARDTACAVGFLMRESGWQAAVAGIAGSDNRVYVDDVREGPLLAWIAGSGLTREEAALIQPAYSPPPAQAVVDELVASGGSLVGPKLVYSDFAFEALLEGPGGSSPAPPSLADPANFGLANYYGETLFVGASVEDGIGGLAAPKAPFGEDGSQLRITLSYDVEPVDPALAIGSVQLSTFDIWIAGFNSATPGDLILETRIFAADGPIATLVADEYSGDFLYSFPSASFEPERALRVETEAVIAGPAYFTYYLHGFGLVPVPEPATGALLAFGLLLLGYGRRTGRRRVRASEASRV